MSIAAPVAVQTNPFPGLRPFREDEEYLFFGRESQVDAMVNTLAATHFLAVVGTSGSGKSSLVNCGLRPALHRGLLARAGTVWRMAQFRPGSDPLGALARALARDGVLFRGYEGDGLTLAEIIDTTLRMSKLGLIDIFEQARLGEGVNLLVVADQFEELFRYRQLGTSQDERVYGVGAEATAFVNLLLEVREQTTYPIYVVLTMRSDFLGDCAQFPGLPEAINAGQYLVPRLTREERRAAISGPIGVGGAEITPVLLTRLVNDVGDNPDQLSILQHSLNRTWAHWQQEGGQGPLDLRHYNAIGTMAHALDQHAEDAYAELGTERQQQICEKIFKALTDKATDPRGVRRPTTLGTLCELAAATPAEITEVINVFREPSRSFLMPPAGEELTPETVIDISHESLMRVWEKLKTWAEAEAQSARMYRRLAETAGLHAEGKEGLWRDPGLQVALDWRDKERPNEAWAKRYHAGFTQAMSFLQVSVARRDEEACEQEARRQEHEAHRQRERALEQAQALAEEQQRRAELQARATRRFRWLSGGLFVILLLAVVNAVFALSQSLRAKQQERVATARQLAAQGLSRKVRLDLALLSSLEANHLTNRVDTRGDLLDRLQRSPHLTAFLTGHTSFVSSVAFSPDSKTLASGSRDNTIILWDVASHQRLGILTGHRKPVRSVAFSPDGKTLASGSDDSSIILWDVASHQRLGDPLMGHDGYPVRSVAFSPDGKTLASGGGDNTVILWDVAGRRPLGTPLTGHTSSVPSLAFSPDGKILAVGNDDTTILLWDVTTHQPLGNPLTGYTTPVRSVAFSPDGKTLAAGSNDTIVILWDVATHQRLGDPLTGHTSSVPSVAFSPDGKILASGSRDTTIILWDVATHRPLGAPLTGHADSIQSLTFSPDGKALASGSSDKTIILWDVIPHSLGIPLMGLSNPVQSVAFSPDGKTLASGSDDTTIILWDVATHQQLGNPFTSHTNFLWSVAFSPDGKTLALGSKDNTVILWDVSPRSLDISLTGHTNLVLSVVFSPDGKTLASGSKDNTVILWDVTTHQPLGPPLTGHTSSVLSLAFSPDGKTLASGSRDTDVILWDVASHQRLGNPLTGHANSVRSLAFSPDGKTLASGSDDNTIMLWDVATHQRLGDPLTGHTRPVRSIAFSPDGETLASGSDDTTIILWDMATRQQLGNPLTGHTNLVLSMAFSPDGKTLASGSDDNVIILWDVSLESWQNRACRIANRNFTRVEWQRYVGDFEPYRATCPGLPLEEKPAPKVKAKTD